MRLSDEKLNSKVGQEYLKTDNWKNTHPKDHI